MKRWICPQCGAGKLAPERPRKDDVRRYCLACSKKTGRLVPRSCPALDLRRERSAAKRAEKRKRDANKERDRWTHAGVHVPTLAKACWKALHKVGGVRHLWWQVRPTRMPEVKLLRTQPGNSRGRAWSHGVCRIYVDPKCDAARLRMIVLHELAHIGVGLQHHHDVVFNGALADAAHELWGFPGGGGEGYSGDVALTAWLREQLKEGKELSP